MVKIKKPKEIASLGKPKAKAILRKKKNRGKKLILVTDGSGKNTFIESQWGGSSVVGGIKKSSREHANAENRFKVKEKHVGNATKAVFKLLEEQTKTKNELFDDGHAVYLQMTTVKVPKCPKRVIRLSLKHSLVSEDGEICLIAGDLMEVGRKKHDRVVEHYEELLKEKGVANVKIMPYHQLRLEYNQFELKRRLVGTHDYFLVEGKISNRVNRFLGKIFLKKHKEATPVKLDGGDVKRQIEEALTKVPLFITSKGDTFTVQVGHTKMDKKKIVDNVYSVIESLDKSFPGGWENIRALNLKGATTLACPIYLTLKEKNTVDVPVVHANRPKLFEPVTGELTTRNAASVTVYPTGNIKIGKLEEDEGFGDEKEDAIADETIEYIQEEKQEEEEKMVVKKKRTNKNKLEETFQEEMEEEKKEDNERMAVKKKRKGIKDKSEQKLEMETEGKNEEGEKIAVKKKRKANKKKLEETFEEDKDENKAEEEKLAVKKQRKRKNKRKGNNNKSEQKLEVETEDEKIVVKKKRKANKEKLEEKQKTDTARTEKRNLKVGKQKGNKTSKK